MSQRRSISPIPFTNHRLRIQCCEVLCHEKLRYVTRFCTQAYWLNVALKRIIAIYVILTNSYFIYCLHRSIFLSTELSWFGLGFFVSLCTMLFHMVFKDICILNETYLCQNALICFYAHVFCLSFQALYFEGNIDSIF